MTTESHRELVDKRRAHLETERREIEPLWRELRDAFLPGRGRFNDEKPADRRKVRLPNNKPVIAARTLGSGLHAGLTSPARPWLKSSVQDDALSEWGPVKAWLATVDERMLGLFARSNLYQTLPAMYQEYGTFGTMAALAFESPASGLRFEPYTVGTYWIARDGEGVVDTLYRCFPMTVRQCVERFGYDALHLEVRRMWDNPAQRENKVEILHAVEPDGMGAWSSCYYDAKRKDGPRGGLLKKARFATNPILSATWETVVGETYASTCPGMIALGDARALQVDERDKAQALQLHHKPPLQGPNLMAGISRAPGAYNVVDALQATGQSGAIRSLYEFQPDIRGLLDNIARLESRIDQAYFVDLFLMLTLDERAQRATAEEIRAKYDEKVLALGPTLEQANGMLRQLHALTFDFMVRQSQPIWEGRLDGEPMLPPPPKEMEGAEILPEFVSALQMAQRAQRLQGLERYAAAAGNIAALTGAKPDKFNEDQWLDEYAAGLGIPPGVNHDDDTVAAMREEQAQQAQMQQMAAMAPALKQGADAVAGLAQTQPAEGNLLAALAQGVA